MDYLGTIIEESLSAKNALQGIKILDTKVEDVTDKHQTPWLKQWTLHKVEIGEVEAEDKARYLSKFLDITHPGSWYMDYKNDQYHYIIFPDKVFKIDLQNPSPDLYKEAKDYGISLGIPEHQVDFKVTF